MTQIIVYFLLRICSQSCMLATLHGFFASLLSEDGTNLAYT